MKIYPLTSERLQNIPHDKIVMEFMSNIVEGNKEVKEDMMLELDGVAKVQSGF